MLVNNDAVLLRQFVSRCICNDLHPKKKPDCSPLSILAIIGIRIHDFLLPIDISTVSECV